MEANQGTPAHPPFFLLSSSHPASLPPHPPAEVLVLNRGLFCFSLLPLNVDVLGH